MRQTGIVALALAIGLIFGYLLGASVAKRTPLGADASVEWHWKRVNDYRAALRNLPVQPPFDPESSLLALSQAGEIDCIELLLPTVPENREVNEYWIKYLQGHPDVLEAQGLPQSSAIRFTGHQPLYLKIWCRKSAIADIQRLVVELEALAAGSGAPPRIPDK